jgi:hypothetical protein
VAIVELRNINKSFNGVNAHKPDMTHAFDVESERSVLAKSYKEERAQPGKAS